MKKSNALISSKEALKRDLRSEVYNQIKKDILNGKLEQGSWLQEDELAERYDVSRTPVREALQRLEIEGLLEIFPRRGAFVVKLTFKSVMEMAQIRESLEDLAVTLAATRASPKILDELRHCLEPNVREAKEGKLALANRMSRFHELLAKASGNEALSRILIQINEKLDLYRLKALEIPGRSSRTLTEHLAILDALEKRNIKLARARNRAHMRRVLKEIQDNVHLF